MNNQIMNGVSDSGEDDRAYDELVSWYLHGSFGKRVETLVVNPIAVIEEHEVPQSVPSDWVFERVKSFCHAVGLSCEGFKDQMLALFSAIEASRHQNRLVSVPDVCFRTTNKGNQELKRLVCSVNYDINGGQSNKGRGKGRGSISSL